jgi:hypothetical protein
MKRIQVETASQVNVTLKHKKHKFDLPTQEHDPQLPGVFVFSGTRGSGKTHACIAMCKDFETKGYTTRTFLICPTRESNHQFDHLSTLAKEDTCEDTRYFNSFLKHIVDEIKGDWTEYEDELAYAKLYKKWRSGSPYISMREERTLEERGGSPPQLLPRPSHLLIIDDAQGTNLFSNARENLMSHLTIKHRHLPLSICYLVQTYMGLPRTIRLNATHFMLYKTQDLKQLRQLYEAFGNLVTWHQFLKLYKTATDHPHGFLYIDTVPKTENKRFRNGFNEYLLSEPEK